MWFILQIYPFLQTKSLKQQAFFWFLKKIRESMHQGYILCISGISKKFNISASSEDKIAYF